ncbi:uncharacterized protein LOC144637890 [Oculina patagonica]
MNKALFTALVVVLITGLLLGQACSMLRAGRDKIAIPRNSAKKQLELKPEVYQRVKPVYLRKASYRHTKPLGNTNKKSKGNGLKSDILAYNCDRQKKNKNVVFLHRS